MARYTAPMMRVFGDFRVGKSMGLGAARWVRTYAVQDKFQQPFQG